MVSEVLDVSRPFFPTATSTTAMTTTSPRTQPTAKAGAVRLLDEGASFVLEGGKWWNDGQALLEAHTTGSADLPYYLALPVALLVGALAGASFLAALVNLRIPETGARYEHQERNPMKLIADFANCSATRMGSSIGNSTPRIAIISTSRPRNRSRENA